MAVAWFTEGSARQPTVKWALSDDSGQTFGPSRIIDQAAPLGRVDVAFLDDGSVVVLWVAGGDATEVRARRYPPSGDADAPVVVGRITAQRSSGFPRMASIGDGVLVAWTDTAGPRLAMAKLSLRPR